nr:carboxypeptidase-like regulatory domain-containing protein [uncultured Porphyromonas sp.]
MRPLLTDLTLLILLLVMPMAASGQVSGRVISDSDSEPLPGATVLLVSASGKHLAYCISGSEGQFFFKSTPSGATQISVSLMSYATEQIPLRGASFPLTIRLREEAFQLKEVAVQAKSIIADGDTVTYLVSAFAQKSDRSIGDVLKRMPGLQVESSGKVLYQGKEINRFYIEGQDLLGSKYGVATKGVSPDDIGAVEVMENHQPMQVLQGISLSDQAALNLKLKEGRKSAWLIHGSAGGGYMRSPRQGLWQGDVFALRASAATQTLLSLKGNNTGLDFSEEQMEFGLAPRATALHTPLELSLLPAVSLLPKRTLLNQGGINSVNHMWSVTPTLQARVMGDYLEDHRTASGEVRTTYLSPTGDRELVERRDDRSTHRMLRGRLVLEANQPSYYLSNTARVQLDKERPDLHTSGTFTNRQVGEVSDLYLSNDLRCIRRISGDHLLFLQSQNEWESLPSQLHLMSGGEEGTELIRDRALATKESLSYDYLLGQVYIGVEAGVRGLFRRLESEGAGALPVDITAAQRLDLMAVSLSPKLKWHRQTTEVTLGLPLEYSHYAFGPARPSIQYVLLSPSLSLTTRPLYGLSLSLRAGGGRSPIVPGDLFEGQWMTDYRTVSTGYEEMVLKPSYRISASASYRDLSKGLFSHLMILHHGGESPYKTRRVLEDGGLIRLYNDKERSRMRSTMMSGRVNLAIGAIHGGGSLITVYSHTTREAIAEEVPIRFGTDLLTVKGMLNSNITSRLFLLYEMSYSGSRLSLPVEDRKPTRLYGMTHALEATYTPADPLTMTLRGEYYRSRITSDLTKQMVMMDLDLTWSVSRRIELEAGLHNLLNNDRWDYTTYGLLTRQTVSRQLRGRSLLLTLRVK